MISAAFFKAFLKCKCIINLSVRVGVILTGRNWPDLQSEDIDYQIKDTCYMSRLIQRVISKARWMICLCCVVRVQEILQCNKIDFWSVLFATSSLRPAIKE